MRARATILMPMNKARMIVGTKLGLAKKAPNN